MGLFDFALLYSCTFITCHDCDYFPPVVGRERNACRSRYYYLSHIYFTVGCMAIGNHPVVT